MSFVVIKAPNEVLHLQFDTRISMTTSLCRLDAYSESPLNSLRAKVNTDWSAFLALLLSEDPDYFTFWEGFNIPGKKVKDFFSTYPESALSTVENQIKSLMNSKDYLIATDLTSTPETVAHELAHARWATDSIYKAIALHVVNAIPENLRPELDAGLLAYGYPQVTEILDDEIHAYLLTSNSKELQYIFTNLSMNDINNLSINFKMALSIY